jgi:hypothetical protein
LVDGRWSFEHLRMTADERLQTEDD